MNKNNDSLGNKSDSSAFIGNESHFVNSDPFILGDEKDEISSSANISKKASSQIENHESDDFNNTNTKSSKPEYEQNSAIVLEGDV